MTQSHITPGVLVADRFEVEALAGVGGMGLVFRARDRHTGQLVALKLLQDSGLKADRLERFWREAQTLAELRHPGIAAHVAHGRTAQGEPFLAMEWLEGESLASRLRRSPLSIGETLAIAQSVGAALATVHRRGIIHRDIKPSNLLLRDGRAEGATLLDFGLARLENGALRMTRTGEVMGSLYYLAPEQARGERRIGPAVGHLCARLRAVRVPGWGTSIWRARGGGGAGAHPVRDGAAPATAAAGAPRGTDRARGEDAVQGEQRTDRPTALPCSKRWRGSRSSERPPGRGRAPWQHRCYPNRSSSS